MTERSIPPSMSPSDQLQMRGAEASEARWFAEEVHAHEPSLKAYLRGSFPSVRDVDDVVQESYLRIWKARAARPIQSARAFLFKVARHVALDLVRRERISPIDLVRDFSQLTVLDESDLGVAERVGLQEKIRLLGEAIACLPACCREIVILRKLKGIPQKEVAARLGIAEKTVEAQVSRGVRRCEEYLSKRGVFSLYDDEAR